MRKRKIIVLNEDIEQKILLLEIIGTLVALKNHCITIEEAEKFIFSPANIDEISIIFNDKKVKHIIDILETGCLLENYESLLPHKLNTKIDVMIQDAINLLKIYPKNETEHWFKYAQEKE